MNVQRPLTGAERAKRWRAAMRAKGLKPRTFWLPDMRLPEVQERIKRDVEALNRWYDRNPQIVEELEALRDQPDVEG
jgi:Protein  of unknown function (DUF3018)